MKGATMAAILLSTELIASVSPGARGGPGGKDNVVEGGAKSDAGGGIGRDGGGSNG